MAKYPRKLEELRDFAFDRGAHRALIVPTTQLTIRQSARAKCYIPACKFLRRQHPVSPA